jgi:putative ABC transport system ATP-binding protein
VSDAPDRPSRTPPISGKGCERLSISGLRSPLAGPFDLAVGAGNCVGITGASGSGKSLFLRMVADLDPNEGSVRLDGRDRSEWPAPEWRRHVVHVAAESGWWTEGVAQHFPARTLDTARSLVDRLGLKPELLDGTVARLSTGEKQRLALARALLLTPPVLLLDEPTSALDETSTDRVEAVLRERMTEGTSIVIVTHDGRQAQRLAQRHYVMSGGRLEAA